MSDTKHTDFSKIQKDFIEAYSCAYYDSKNYEAGNDHWVTRACVKQGVDQPLEDIIDCMKKTIDDAPTDKKVQLLNNYPTLSYKIRDLNAMSRESRSEQMGVGLDQCSPEEGAELGALNKQYKEKFGFPFIVAVRGVKDRYAILAAMRERVQNDFDAELNTAIIQIHKIAEFRLRDKIPAPKPKVK